METSCSVQGCGGTHLARGYCAMHYRRWRVSQTPACSKAGCDARVEAKGLCGKHYAALRRAGGYRRPAIPCSIDGCGGNQDSRGLCSKHYRRLMDYGDPLRELPTDAERLWAKIVRRTAAGCWEVTPMAGCKGYGSFGMGGGEMGSHRAAWIVAHGEIPAGLWVLHTCDNPPCINPEHLYLGDCRDNVRDRVERDRSFRGPRPSGITRGEASGNAKLTERDVREIRVRYAAGGVTQARLATDYGVGGTVVSYVIRRKSWTHVLP